MSHGRWRTKSSIEAIPLCVRETRWLDCSNPDWRQISTHGCYPAGVEETMYDHVLSGKAWRTKVTKGEIVFNPMVKTVITFDSTNASNGPHIKYGGTSFSCSGVPRSYEYKYGAGSLDHLWHNAKTGGTLPGGTATSHPQIDTLIGESDVAAVVGDACTQVWNERGRIAESNLYESLAELHKTKAMISSLLDSIIGVLKGVRPDARPDQLWLAWRYGILPLMMQVEDLIKSRTRKTGKRRETSRGSAKAFASATEVKTLTWGSAIMTFKAQYHETFEVRAVSIDEGEIFAFENVGLSAKNLLTLPWELLSYSFVVDWFVNLGDWIGASVPSPMLDQLGSGFTRTRTQTVTITPVSTIGNGGYVVVAPITGKINCTRQYVERIAPLEPPKLVLRPNPFTKKDGSLKMNRVADAVALITQHFSIKGRRTNRSLKRS